MQLSSLIPVTWMESLLHDCFPSRISRTCHNYIGQLHENSMLGYYDVCCNQLSNRQIGLYHWLNLNVSWKIRTE